MGTETYEKDGQTSKKEHGGKGQQSKEHYKRHMFEAWPAVSGAPDGFERKFTNDYRKSTLPSQEA